jgi:hypothetical protein
MPLPTLALGCPKDSRLQELALKVKIQFDFMEAAIDPVAYRIEAIPKELLWVGSLVLDPIVVGCVLGMAYCDV